MFSRKSWFNNVSLVVLTALVLVPVAVSAQKLPVDKIKFSAKIDPANLPPIGLDAVDKKSDPAFADLIDPDVLDNPARRDVLPPHDLPFARKWVWALSGGGAQGSFQVGALTYLGKNLSRYRPRAVCGTSVGAINALPVAEGTPEGFEKLKNSWLALARNQDMYEVASWIRDIQSLDTFSDINLEAKLMGDGDLGDLVSGGVVTELTMEFASTIFVPIVGQLLVADTLSDIQRDLEQAMEWIDEAQFIYSLAPTRIQVEEHLDLDAIDRSGILLRLVSVALENGYRCYVTERGDAIQKRIRFGGYSYDVRKDLAGSRRQNVIDGAMASAGIPVLFPPVVLEFDDGETLTCVDGGVRDVMPLNAAKDLLENELAALPGEPGVIAISATAMTPSNDESLFVRPEAEDFSTKNLAEIAQRGLALAVDEVFVSDIAPDGGWCDGIERTIIMPQFNVHGPTEIDPGLIQISMAYGYMTAFDTLKRSAVGEAEYSEMLFTTNVIAQARKRAWKLENTGILRGHEIRPRFRPGVLEEIRGFKHLIRDAVNVRVQRWGWESIPAPADITNSAVRNFNHYRDWWRAWERHRRLTGPYWLHTFSTNDFYRSGSPWDEHLNTFGDVVPAEEPPANIFVPLFWPRLIPLPGVPGGR